MQVVPGGHRCPCGNRGCWEQYSSGNALVREARELAAADSPVAYGIIEHVKGQISDITGPMITELARDGDAMCIELLQDIGQWLGVGIANLAAALDPSCFVIGGGVSAADDLLIGPARDAFKRHLTGRGYRPEARIRAQLRDYEHSEGAIFRLGAYEFRPAAKMLVDEKGRKIRLTEKETNIRKYLYRAGEKAVSREELLAEVWGYNAGVTTHTLETHVYRLRQKIEPDPANARLLLTEQGGYRLAP